MTTLLKHSSGPRSLPPVQAATIGHTTVPVVGLGGSTGSISALRAFFDSLPQDSGQAYVVMLHLSAADESALADVLQRATGMRVLKLQTAEQLEPDTVYVIPARNDLGTIDHFFHTLADTHGPRACAIVFSGTGGDGAMGLKRIKERGGLTIAQEPGEAEFDSMPRTAISTGMVDWVLPAQAIGARLFGYHRQEGKPRSTADLEDANGELQAMNEQLRSATEALETSRKELQSVNEELTTVNSKLKSKLEELSRATSDMHNLMDATGVATVFLDRHLRITRYTPSAASLFDLSATDVGRAFGDLVSRLHYPMLGNDASSVLQTQMPVEREVVDRGGHWYLARLRPYRTIDDRIAGVVLAFVDITERKRAEAALRNSEEHLRMVVENAREYAIFTTDLDRRITGWNTGAQRILGYSESEALGRSGDMIFLSEEQARGVPEAEARQALVEGRAGDDRWHVRKDGSRLWASGVLMTMHDAAGKLAGFVKILRDQTDARHTQQILEQALMDNENARAALEAANVAKDQFLAVLSHELRTPLTPAVMALQLLSRRDDIPADVHEALRLIHRNIRIESHLIDDLLDLTRISRGTLEVAREQVDLHDVIRSAIDICSGDLQAKHQSLTLLLDASASRALGDAHRLQQVVWNLLKNASKFTPAKGQIRITSSVNDGRFRMEVTDNGVGIDAEALPRIFEAFIQGGAWVAREFGGLGLGLSISKATIEAHGGTLRASSPGRGLGATFTLELPLAAM